jgi:hypothetical protein
LIQIKIWLNLNKKEGGEKMGFRRQKLLLFLLFPVFIYFYFCLIAFVFESNQKPVDFKNNFFSFLLLLLFIILHFSAGALSFYYRYRETEPQDQAQINIIRLALLFGLVSYCYVVLESVVNKIDRISPFNNL